MQPSFCIGESIGSKNKGGGTEESRGATVHSSKSGGLSPLKEFMKNKRIEEFQEHFYKLDPTGSAKPSSCCSSPKIEISYILI